jgi:hypothetical protein
MTQLEFDNYKLQIQYILSKKAAAQCDFLAIGKEGLNNDQTNLDLLVTYLEIMQTYTLELVSVGDEDTVNFFTRDEMQDIVTHINKICNTYYNVDFILET